MSAVTPGAAWWEPVIDHGLVPDPLLRRIITARVAAKVRHETRGSVDERSERLRSFIEARTKGPVTRHVDDANRQHYEVPTSFFEQVLGPRLKYSAAIWPAGVDDLADAEEATLALTAARARLSDRQRVLELGCGWGSLSLWMAERYPGSDIVAVSNSATQRAHIEARAADAGVDNLTVVTADIADFEPEGTFDRVVSVEMLEHVNNHGELLVRIARWLEPDGLAFAHVFAHREMGWEFDAGSAGDWMGRYFFTGGVMPSDDLLPRVACDLDLVDHWRLSGRHYQRTLNAWLSRLDQRRDAVLPILAATYGADRAEAWFHRWRVFFMASAQLWGYRRGNEFLVSHYLFQPR
ncbi:MAG: cyclopropane-fatty-acyl-phospholipid synthase family protein [Acidimicrobiales bacterium]|nr:cyclopropane-fatty-acyl-phospholipid synthase family protein [Acidimicrobiales bacterium]